MSHAPRQRAFTLIELLIVVAIIAILAAIAIPNLLEAQVRAKVSRTRSDMRTMTTALEAYVIEHGSYIGCVDVNRHVTTNLTPGSTCTPRINALVQVTTPVAFITSVPRDVFNTMDLARTAFTTAEDERVLVYWGPDFLIQYRQFDLKPRTGVLFREFREVTGANGRVRDPLWCLLSLGPDQDLDVEHRSGAEPTSGLYQTLAVIQGYDPTNGTLSDGDIVRFRE